MMGAFVILDLVDHVTDGINAFFLPHSSSFTAAGITIAFLLPLCLFLNELVGSDDK